MEMEMSNVEHVLGADAELSRVAVVDWWIVRVGYAGWMRSEGVVG